MRDCFRGEENERNASNQRRRIFRRSQRQIAAPRTAAGVVIFGGGAAVWCWLILARRGRAARLASPSPIPRLRSLEAVTA